MMLLNDYGALDECGGEPVVWRKRVWILWVGDIPSGRVYDSCSRESSHRQDQARHFHRSFPTGWGIVQSSLLHLSFVRPQVAGRKRQGSGRSRPLLDRRWLHTWTALSYLDSTVHNMRIHTYISWDLWFIASCGYESLQSIGRRFSPPDRHQISFMCSTYVWEEITLCRVPASEEFTSR